MLNFGAFFYYKPGKHSNRATAPRDLILFVSPVKVSLFFRRSSRNYPLKLWFPAIFVMGKGLLHVDLAIGAQKSLWFVYLVSIPSLLLFSFPFRCGINIRVFFLNIYIYSHYRGIPCCSLVEFYFNFLQLDSLLCCSFWVLGGGGLSQWNIHPDQETLPCCSPWSL